MNINQYCISLRQDILTMVTGIKNAGFSLYWDNTTPNYVTREKLQEIYQRHLKLAASYGLYLVTRHCECPNSSHGGYLISNDYGLDITYDDDGYIWNGYQMFQGERVCVCPCSEENEPTKHWVIDDVIFKDTKHLSDGKKFTLFSRTCMQLLKTQGINNLAPPFENIS